MEYTQMDVNNYSYSSLVFVDWMAQQGFIRRFPHCGLCGLPTVLQVSGKFTGDGVCYRCNSCQSYVSVRTGSYFERGNLSLEQQMRLMIAYASHSTISNTALQWSINRKSVSSYFAYYRSLVVEWVDGFIAGGLFNFDWGVVECDEALFLNVYDESSGVMLPRQWVIAMKHRGSGLIWMERIPDRRSASIMPVVLAHVADGSIVCTDEFSSYNPLEDKGFFRFSVNHSIDEYVRYDVNPITDEALVVSVNACESIFALLRSRVRNVRYRTCVHLDRAMSEIMFESTGLNLFDLVKV